VKRSFRKTGAVRTWLILAIVMAAGAGTLKLTVFRGGQAEHEIETARVSSGNVVMKIETNGTIEPLSTVQVGCQVMGRIIETGAENDHPVKKDQVIARIDPDLMKAEHEQAKADFARTSAAEDEAESRLQEQKANLPIITQQALGKKQEAEAALLQAEFDYKRITDIRKNEAGFASEAELTAANSAKLRAEAAVTSADAAYRQSKNNEVFVQKSAEQAVAQARAAVETAKARLDATATKLDQCVIRSPIDGIVLKRYTEVGTTVNPAFQIQPLYLLAPSLKRMRVNARVSESDIVHIEKGQPATFSLEAKGHRTYAGEILEKRNQPDVVQGVVTYTVVFEVENDEEGTLLPGLTVNVEIQVLKREKAALIPNTVLRFKPPLTLEERQQMNESTEWPAAPTVGPDGNPLEYVSKASAWTFDPVPGKWKLVPIWIGITDNTNTEMLGGADVDDVFVKKFIDRSESGFSFQEIIRQASPANRRVF
jgi:HlyD family secretion protein